MTSANIFLSGCWTDTAAVEMLSSEISNDQCRIIRKLWNLFLFVFDNSEFITIYYEKQKTDIIKEKTCIKRKNREKKRRQLFGVSAFVFKKNYSSISFR